LKKTKIGDRRPFHEENMGVLGSYVKVQDGRFKTEGTPAKRIRTAVRVHTLG
jgi:hypothetical protein